MRADQFEAGSVEQGYKVAVNHYFVARYETITFKYKIENIIISVTNASHLGPGYLLINFPIKSILGVQGWGYESCG